MDGTRPDNFSYTLRRREEEAGVLWIHCLHRNWDVRLGLTHSLTSRLDEAYGTFAARLVDSVEVPPGTVGRPLLHFGHDTCVRVQDGTLFYTEVVAVRVRQVARLASPDGRSYLDLTQVRDMRLTPTWDTIASTGEQHGRVGRITATPAEDSPAQGRFTSWYEASVVSACGDSTFAENESLSFGDEARWTSAALRDAGVFEAVYGPALRMVAMMDGVGVAADNGQTGKLDTPPILSGNPTTLRDYAHAPEQYW